MYKTVYTHSTRCPYGALKRTPKGILKSSPEKIQKKLLLDSDNTCKGFPEFQAELQEDFKKNF